MLFAHVSMSYDAIPISYKACHSSYTVYGCIKSLFLCFVCN